jgi:hypothetical protein
LTKDPLDLPTQRERRLGLPVGTTPLPPFDKGDARGGLANPPQKCFISQNYHNLFIIKTYLTK